MSRSIDSILNILFILLISFSRFGLTNRIFRYVSGSMNGEMAFQNTAKIQGGL